MLEKIHIFGNEPEMLKVALKEENYRQAAELERKIIEKLMIYFVEKSGHTLSGLTTFRAKCNETERLSRLYGKNPDSLFENIRTWQNEKDYLLFEGTKRVVTEKEFEAVAAKGLRLISVFTENAE